MQTRTVDMSEIDLCVFFPAEAAERWRSEEEEVSCAPDRAIPVRPPLGVHNSGGGGSWKEEGRRGSETEQ